MCQSVSRANGGWTWWSWSGLRDCTARRWRTFCRDLTTLPKDRNGPLTQGKNEESCPARARLGRADATRYGGRQDTVPQLRSQVLCLFPYDVIVLPRVEVKLGNAILSASPNDWQAQAPKRNPLQSRLRHDRPSHANQSTILIAAVTLPIFESSRSIMTIHQSSGDEWIRVVALDGSSR